VTLDANTFVMFWSSMSNLSMFNLFSPWHKKTYITRFQTHTCMKYDLWTLSYNEFLPCLWEIIVNLLITNNKSCNSNFLASANFTWMCMRHARAASRSLNIIGIWIWPVRFWINMILVLNTNINAPVTESVTWHFMAFTKVFKPKMDTHCKVVNLFHSISCIFIHCRMWN
jgi:hypothetical protein